MIVRRRGTPTCAYRVDAELVELLDARLGPPLDSYVRGWQVWLEEHGTDEVVPAEDRPRDVTIEWRLHPPAAFEMPRGVDHHDLFELVLQGMAEVDDPVVGPFPIGDEQRHLHEVWEVLEVFPTYGDPLTPEQVVAVATSVLGRRPDLAGYADHARMGDLFKGRGGDFSVADALEEHLAPVRGDG